LRIKSNGSAAAVGRDLRPRAEGMDIIGESIKRRVWVMEEEAGRKESEELEKQSLNAHVERNLAIYHL